MFKKQYQLFNEQIHATEDLIESTKRMVQQKNKTSTKISFYKKPVLIIAFILVLIFSATPVLASTVPNLYELLYFVSPSVAQFFMPINKSCTDNGIKMEVVSAYIENNEALIYITMQDLTGNRIDATTDLFDSYSINRPFNSSASCSRINFDETTKTATFLISISEWGSKKIVGDKITFSVREFISDKQKYLDMPIHIALDAINEQPQTKKVDPHGFGGINIDDFKNSDMPVTVLAPSQEYNFGLNAINISAIGYIDGMLHIQTSTTGKLLYDNHGSLYLKDKDGNKINCNYQLSFRNHYEAKGRIDYEEYVFDISNDELKNYTLHGDFITANNNIKGNWRVTFPLKNKK